MGIAYFITVISIIVIGIARIKVLYNKGYISIEEEDWLIIEVVLWWGIMFPISIPIYIIHELAYFIMNKLIKNK